MEMAIGAGLSLQRRPAPARVFGTPKTSENLCGWLGLSFWKNFRDRLIDVRLGKSALAKAMNDPDRTPMLVASRAPGESERVGKIIDVAPPS
jgi:hypothetical protein